MMDGTIVDLIVRTLHLHVDPEELNDSIVIEQGELEYYDGFLFFEEHELTTTLLERKETRKIRISCQRNVTEGPTKAGEVLCRFEDNRPALILSDSKAFFYFDVFGAITHFLNEQGEKLPKNSLKRLIATKLYWNAPSFLRKKVREFLRKQQTPVVLEPEAFFGTTANALVFLLEELLSRLMNRKPEYTPRFLITHDIDTNYCQKALRSLVEIEKKHDTTSLVFFTPRSYEYTPDWAYIKELDAEGFGVGIHGYRHDGLLTGLEKGELKSRLKAALDEFLAHGIRVKAFRSPWMLRNDEMLQALDELGFSFDLSYPDRDRLALTYPLGGVSFNRPYRPIISGTRDSSLIEIPSSYPQDVQILEDYGLDDDEAFLYWKKKIDFVKAFRGVFVLHTHPIHLAKRPRLFESIIRYLKSEGFSSMTLEEI